MRARLFALLLLVLAAAPAAQAAEPTGRWLVVFEQARTARSSSLLNAVLARSGVHKAGRGVGALGIATVDGSPAALARLRRDSAVESVSAEWRRDFRRAPNDPGFSQQQPDSPGGTPVQWWLERENFPAAWDIARGSGATVGILDSGIDAGHPQLGPKIASTDAFGTLTSPQTDEDGHGTHVSGLACAVTDDSSGLAGAGWDCRIALVKIPELLDEDIVNGIYRAVERGANAINMSFGGGAESAALAAAIEFAFSRGVVLVASASNSTDNDQGAPASQLQPNDASDINAGRGLVVTAVDFFDVQAGTGVGPQISLAAYGFYDSRAPFEGPLGLLSTYPAGQTPRELPPLLGCECRETFNGDDRYAYLEGTSMATPQVTAVAAMVGALNPALTASEKIRLIKQTAQRGGGGWTSNLGWGVLDAGAALDAARRIDRTAPTSRAGARRRSRRPKRMRLGIASSDAPGSSGLVASGVRSVDVYMKRGKGRFRRIRTATTATLLRLRLRAGVYRFYTRALDAEGNREAIPAHADVRVRVLRRR